MSRTKHDEVAKQRAEIFKTIYGVKRGLFSEVLDLFIEDYESHKNKGINKILELYRDYSYAIFFMYSPSSIRNNLVAFRNEIKKRGGKYMANALEAFTIKNVYKPLNKDNFEQKTELKEAVQKGDNTKIDPQIVIDKINEIKETLEKRTYHVAKNQKEEQVRAYYIVAMLGLATGRRFTELLKTLNIKKRGTKITFSGLLKGNNKPIEGHIIGLTYKEVQKYLKELRAWAKTENMTEDEVNKKYARVFNNAMKRLGFTNVKATRHNYSIAGSQLFRKKGESIEDTITRILGHRENFTSALNYT
jgi:hypothetical protein